MASTTTKTRKAKTKVSAKVRAEHAEKVSELVAEIADKAQELATAEGWQAMLTGAAAGLWRDSLNNQLLPGTSRTPHARCHTPDPATTTRIPSQTSRSSAGTSDPGSQPGQGSLPPDRLIEMAYDEFAGDLGLCRCLRRVVGAYSQGDSWRRWCSGFCRRV
ncbi:MAG: hypothetical protein ACRDP8_13615 [Actinopolymorphaceae bacterium]